MILWEELQAKLQASGEPKTNSSFLDRRFFVFFFSDFSPAFRTTRRASLSFSSRPWASFCWIGRRPGTLMDFDLFFCTVCFWFSFRFHFITFRFHLVTFYYIFFDYNLMHFVICCICFHLFLRFVFLKCLAWLAQSLGDGVVFCRIWSYMNTEAANFIAKHLP